MLIAETARCVDCYAVLFRDEMNQCPAGHFVCSGCLCDCDVLAHLRTFTQPPDVYEAALRSWGAEGMAVVSESPVLELPLQYSVDR